MSYRVIWEIDVDADDATEAAIKAQEIQRDPQSIATVFTVQCDDGARQEIDLGGGQ